MLPLTDTTMHAVEWALRGIQMRQDVHAHNVANVNTPNYIGQRVDFESSLQAALGRGDVDSLTKPGGNRSPSVENAMGIADKNGNTVQLEDEMVGMVKNNLSQQAMVNAYNFKINVLRTAIGRR